MVAPRTVSFTDEEFVELGKEMVQWVKDNDPLHLSEWYTIEKMFTYNQWKAFLQIDSFLPYYEVALKTIGKKYMDKNSNVREGVSQRWQRVYFKDLKEEEDQTLAYKAELARRQQKDDDEHLGKQLLDGIKQCENLRDNQQIPRAEETK